MGNIITRNRDISCSFTQYEDDKLHGCSHTLGAMCHLDVILNDLLMIVLLWRNSAVFFHMHRNTHEFQFTRLKKVRDFDRFNTSA